MADGDVQEFLGGSRALASQLMNQRLAGSPRQEGSYNIGIGNVRELVALPGEALDVPIEGLISLLMAVPLRSHGFLGRLYVPWKFPTKISFRSAQL